MTDEPIKSVWYDLQAEQGAEFEDFDGWLWTATLGDVRKEYEAIRTDVAMWDVYPLVKWDLRGADALRAAQRVFTNDLGSLSVGQVRYGAFVNEEGKMVDDGTVYKLADDHCWVMTNTPGYEDWFASAFEGLGVEFEDRTRRMPLLSVQGPRSRELLQGLTDANLSELSYFRFWPDRVEVAGIPVWVLRTGFSGELGFELIADPEDAAFLWRAVQGAGATPFGTHAVEIARIESGMIVIAVDYQPGEGTPYDLSFDRLVKLDSGFLGADRRDSGRAARPAREAARARGRPRSRARPPGGAAAPRARGGAVRPAGGGAHPAAERPGQGRERGVRCGRWSRADRVPAEGSGGHRGDGERGRRRLRGAEGADGEGWAVQARRLSPCLTCTASDEL